MRITHVRAHARNPGNETADALAKLGADGQQGDVLHLALPIHIIRRDVLTATGVAVATLTP